MARVYATEADLIAYGAPPGVALPTGPEAVRKLTRASELLDGELLRTAVYDTNPVTLLPTSSAVITALRDAVCAQVIWWSGGGGDETGTSGQYQDIALGSLKLSRTSGGSGGATPVPRYAEQALTHLRAAGLLNGPVGHYQGR